eukprot:scaffold90162_cov15-Tisochrysis_lutea.AAC.2
MPAAVPAAPCTHAPPGLRHGAVSAPAPAPNPPHTCCPISISISTQTPDDRQACYNLTLQREGQQGRWLQLYCAALGWGRWARSWVLRGPGSEPVAPALRRAE